MKFTSIVLVLFLISLIAPPSSLSSPSAAAILITAVYYDPPLTGEDSEAVQLQNIGDSPVSLANWHIADDVNTVTFPADTTIDPIQKIWITRSASAFRSEFGFEANYEYGNDSEPAIPNLTGDPFSLHNSGDSIWLQDNQGAVVDAVAYGNATLDTADWQGTGVQPYRIGDASIEGQVLYRKLQERDGRPIADTNTAHDWAQDTADNALGKRLFYPGWDLDEFFQTAKAREFANVKYCVAPDSLFECVRDEIIAASQTISVEIYSLSQAALVNALTDRLDQGVNVSVLLDGGALEDQGKWACEELEAHGGQCWLMAGKPQSSIRKRYDNLHGKWMIFDQARVAIGSENIDGDAMPSDDKSDGTYGARGGYLVTDSPTLVQAAQAILERDFDPLHHADVRRWGTNANDFPPLGFVPNYDNGGTSYRVRYPIPFTLDGEFEFELVQCPENCLRLSDGLLGLVARAGQGDTLLTEQLYEYEFWGGSSSNPLADPNLRLEAYLAAAQRRAHVRILLDKFYDSPEDARSNFRTCEYVNQFSGRYDIECRLGNPTGRGIHNKLVLLKQGKQGWVHLGSINGSETSSKLNRELATQLESLEAYGDWAAVFEDDWVVSTTRPTRQWLPFILQHRKP